MFTPVYKYFKKTADSDHFPVWKTKGLSNESIEPPTAFNITLDPTLNDIKTKV